LNVALFGRVLWRCSAPSMAPQPQQCSVMARPHHPASSKKERSLGVVDGIARLALLRCPELGEPHHATDVAHRPPREVAQEPRLTTRDGSPRCAGWRR
jgi:hypothetical protein